MLKKIRYLLSGVALVVALFSVSAPFVVHGQKFPNSIVLLDYLGYQYTAGLFITCLGLVWISVKALLSPASLNYEMLSRNSLMVLLGFLIFLNLSHLVLGIPMPVSNKGDTFPPVVRFGFSGLNICLALILTHLAIWKPAYPRALIILLLMYLGYFTNGVVLIALLLHYPLPPILLFQQAENHYLLWILFLALCGTLLAVAVLSERRSQEEILLQGVNMLKRLRTASKSKEESLKNIEFAKLVIETLVKPPQPPQASTFATVSLDRSLSDWEGKLKDELQKAQEAQEEWARKTEELQHLLAEQQAKMDSERSGKGGKGNKDKENKDAAPPKPDSSGEHT